MCNELVLEKNIGWGLCKRDGAESTLKVCMQDFCKLSLLFWTGENWNFIICLIHFWNLVYFTFSSNFSVEKKSKGVSILRSKELTKSCTE